MGLADIRSISSPGSIRVPGMDPVTLIVTALAAGAATGITESAASAVKDAYRSLLALVSKRLAGRPDAELVLARHETSPETWQAPLVAVLEEAGAEHDTDLVAAAQALMSLMDRAGARAGKYTVDTRARTAFRSVTTTGRTTSSGRRQAAKGRR